VRIIASIRTFRKYSLSGSDITNNFGVLSLAIGLILTLTALANVITSESVVSFVSL
jgi:hypothetical protein